MARDRKGKIEEQKLLEEESFEASTNIIENQLRILKSNYAKMTDRYIYKR